MLMIDPPTTAPELPQPAVVIAMVATAVLALFLAMYLAWISFSRRRIRSIDNGGRDRFVDGGVVVDWVPVPLDPPEASPRPLLDLALQREAARRGPEFRVGLRGRGLAITGAWREKTADDRQRTSDNNDLWHRWTVDACFFRVNESYGACESLDVRARTAFGSSTPPTQWPIMVSVVPRPKGSVPRTPVPTSELL